MVEAARRHFRDDRIIDRLQDRFGLARVQDDIGRWRGPGQWEERDPYQIHGLVVHQSLGSGSVSALARYHTSKNHISPEIGLPSAAYWAYVSRPTDRELARGARPTLHILNSITDRTWSHGFGGLPGDENAFYLSICVGGSFSPAGDQEPLPEQLELVLGAWEVLSQEYHWSLATLFGHCDLGKPACPGAALEGIVKAYRAPYRALAQRNLPLFEGGGAARLLLDPEEVRRANLAWQTALRELRFYFGDLDGIWGRKSVNALVQWRKARMLRYAKSSQPRLPRRDLDQWVLYAEWKHFRQSQAA